MPVEYPNRATTSPLSLGRGENIIILRDDKKKVRAFHNVCRHRDHAFVAPMMPPAPKTKTFRSFNWVPAATRRYFDALTTAGPTIFKEISPRHT